MCGLVGVIGGYSSQAGELASRMIAAIAHRGPDGTGCTSFPGGAFAHARLSIIDLTNRSAQPYRGLRGSLLAFNGEIYNYASLVDCEAEGIPRSDTAVLSLLLEREGVDVVSKLRGMFAFAWWDPDTGVVLLARDTFGIKPLYYATLNGCTVIASEIKAILAAGHEAVVHEPAMASFLAKRRLDSDPPATMFRGIGQLPPGTVAMVRDPGGAIAWRRFGDYRTHALPTGNLADAGATMHRLLADSVRAHRVADVPVGVLASGGLDSSSLAYLSREVEGHNVPVFSSLTPTRTPESLSIATVASECGDGIVLSTTTAEEFESSIVPVLYHQDEPYADGSMVSHFLLMRAIRAAGYKVALSGQGADEVFGGYPLHRDAAAREFIQRADFHGVRSLWSSAERPSIARVILGLSGVDGLAVTLAARRHPTWLDPRLRRLANGVWERIGDATLDDAAERCLSRISVPGFVHYEDRNGMAHGIELRVPYLDRDVVSAALSYPASVHFEGGWSKALLRRAVSPGVPAEIAWRTRKYPYPSALDAWLAEKPAEIARWIRRHSPVTEFFDSNGVERLVRAYEGQPSGHLGPTVWRVFIATAWHRLFIARTLLRDANIGDELR